MCWRHCSQTAHLFFPFKFTFDAVVSGAPHRSISSTVQSSLSDEANDKKAAEATPVRAACAVHCMGWRSPIPPTHILLRCTGATTRASRLLSRIPSAHLLLCIASTPIHLLLSPLLTPLASQYPACRCVRFFPLPGSTMRDSRLLCTAHGHRATRHPRVPGRSTARARRHVDPHALTSRYRSRAHAPAARVRVPRVLGLRLRAPGCCRGGECSGGACVV